LHISGMPRMSRLDTPCLLHHIIIRGIERRRIFNDNKDREDFIERLSLLLPNTKTQSGKRIFNWKTELLEYLRTLYIERTEA